MRTIDAARARSIDTHADAVRAWARSVWAAWSTHHKAITALTRGAGPEASAPAEALAVSQ